ncbi:class IIb bacteriocin, lactobin A/cerein 7B family [Mucilaginibacter sp. SP1R1]|uniref:class IIb bacteriocin, lactobin A/cerein 7B family n=1 Tax=Mucilaginibacter sp. SP1R1 TaxID=2723091 RepID=UPI001622F9FC|nr:class IIb bacteriocin, lactobin A/cerein 7B family [Mucilaginibacter sp. SP1R1]MBB6151926.1 lactobin A/cerein 7B family class IIb bacteriocin [Mucilaginibacter sp. SP1R1]
MNTLERYDNMEVVALSDYELAETEGGFWPVVIAAAALAVAVWNAGYTIGKDLANRDNAAK